MDARRLSRSWIQNWRPRLRIRLLRRELSINSWFAWSCINSRNLWQREKSMLLLNRNGRWTAVFVIVVYDFGEKRVAKALKLSLIHISLDIRSDMQTGCLRNCSIRLQESTGKLWSYQPPARSSLAGVGIFLMSLLIQGLIPMKGIPELSEKSSASAPACIEAENVPFLCLSRTRSRNIIPILIKKERSRWTRLHYVWLHRCRAQGGSLCFCGPEEGMITGRSVRRCAAIGREF